MKIFLVFTFLSITCLLNAQNTIQKGNILPVVGYWHIGAKKNVLYSKAETKVKDAKTTIETTTINALWEIIDSTEKNYVIHFIYQNLLFSDHKDSISRVYAEIFKGITVKYRTNELGVFDTILNIDEIIKHTNEVTKTVFQKLNWPDNEVTRTIIKKTKLLFENPTMLSASISKEMALIHYFYGLEYKLNTTYTYDYFLANTLGGEPFPSIAVYKMTALNTATDRAKLTAVITPIEKKYKRIIYESMVNLAESMGLPKPKKSDFANSITLHKCEAEVSITEGWPIKVTFTKISAIQTSKTIEVVSISLTD